MVREQKLKVFRMPTGFHDAYVAAPSRKAALEAWGSDADLFARGIAEVVIDEELAREPLENPGKVIKRLRGTAEEQIAALPPDAPASGRKRPSSKAEDEAPVVRRKGSTSRTHSSASSGRSRAAERSTKETSEAKPGAIRPKSKPKLKPKPKPKPKPRPSRAKLDEAEGALATLVERQERDEADLRERERALQKERRTMETAHGRDRRSAERAVEREREAHEERLDRWIESNG